MAVMVITMPAPFYIVIAFVACLAVMITSHEAGHFVVAAVCGLKPTLILSWPPCVMWRNATKKQDKAVAIAGFAAELLPLLVAILLESDTWLCAVYLGMCIGHITTYPFRNLGDSSDFNKF